jgi:hypothetical protein
MQTPDSQEPKPLHTDRTLGRVFFIGVAVGIVLAILGYQLYRAGGD